MTVDNLKNDLWIDVISIPDEATHEAYFDTIKDPCDKVNILLDYIDRAKLACAVAASRAEEHSQTARVWERRHEQLQKYGVRLLKKYNTEELPGTYGYIKAWKQPADIKSSISTRYVTDHAIPDELIFSIPERYRQCKIIWELRKDAVIHDLENGKYLNFAKLLDKQTLRIIKTKSEDNYATYE